MGISLIRLLSVSKREAGREGADAPEEQYPRANCPPNNWDDDPQVILGEYGHLIANEAGYSPMEQFQVLHSKSQFCAAPTRALLLSTYIKWVNVFEIKPQLLNVFERYRHVLDVDLLAASAEKIRVNEAKYPVELARGRAEKYDRLHLKDE